MSDPESNPSPPAPPPAAQETAASPPPTADAAAPAAVEGAPAPGGPSAPGAPGASGGPNEGRRGKKKRNRGRSDGRGDRSGGPQGDRHGGGHGGPHRQFVEDQIDHDAEALAREARTVPVSRVRAFALLAQEIRRLAASGDPRDAREARRALVLLKSKVAYLAGREQGREKNALVKVRDFVFRGVDQVVRNRDVPDLAQLMNFLDQLEAFVGYHRFHGDDRRRD